MKTVWKPLLPAFRHSKQEVFSEVVESGQFIHQIGDSKALRQLSQPVKISQIIEKSFQKKLAYLKKCFLEYRQQTGMGRGIAAVQVGIPEQFLLIFMPERQEQFLVMINPVIRKSSSKRLRYPEICMSASPLIAPIIRPEWVEVEYYDQDAKICAWKTRANSQQGKVYNRVIQHEIDHLNGILNIDRAVPGTLEFALDPKFYERASFEQA